MIWRLLWCIELPTEIRRQIKVRALEWEWEWKHESRSENESSTWFTARPCRAQVCVRCVHGCLFAFARKGTMVEWKMYGVLPYCFASTPHLSAVIHGINLYINCCHSCAALYLFHRLGRFIDVFTLFCGLCKYCLCAFPFNLTKQQNKTK